MELGRKVVSAQRETQLTEISGIFPDGGTVRLIRKRTEIMVGIEELYVLIDDFTRDEDYSEEDPAALVPQNELANFVATISRAGLEKPKQIFAEKGEINVANQ